jgi:hypothetical protein
LYTTGSIFMILIYICLAAAISAAIVHYLKIPSLKIMLLGIAILAFSGSILQEKQKSELNEILSIIGFGIFISGLVRKDVNNRSE